MKYKKLITSMPAIAEVKKLRLPYAIAKKIYTLQKNLEAEYAFYSEEELKLIETYAKKDENDKPAVTQEGLISFESLESKNKYLEGMNALFDAEFALEIPSIVITEADIGTQIVSPDTIERLEGLIVFE